jgi:hypothetical protein
VSVNTSLYTLQKKKEAMSSNLKERFVKKKEEENQMNRKRKRKIKIQ